VNFGFELEMRSNAERVVNDLHERGVCAVPHLHNYHCRCGECAYDNNAYLFTAQNDCTVNGEMISKILEYGSDRHYRAVREVTSAMVRHNARVTGDTGLHVHVPRDAFSTRRQRRILFRLMARYWSELSELAAGGQPTVRGYNQPPQDPRYAQYDYYNNRNRDGSRRSIPSGPFDWSGTAYPNAGSWLVTKEATYEFRLWNATRAEWRVNLAIGLSVAMTKAALDRCDTTGPDDPRPIEAILAPYMDDVTWAGVLRQRFHKGGMAA
jgi:hypothetical protein